MESIVIADTSCLIVLDKIGQLPLLEAMYGQVFVTPTVVSEYNKELPKWILVRAPTTPSFQKLLEETIDPGESSSIALAVEIVDCLLILDDLRARKIAASLGLSFTGTLGVIASAKKRGIIPFAKPIFEQIIKTDFRLSDSFLSAILEELGE